MVHILKKCAFLLLLFLGMASGAQATRVYADLASVTAIGNSTWDASTNTFSWTADTYASVVIPGFSGDLSAYTSMVLEIEMNEGQSFRVDFQLADQNWKTAAAYYSVSSSKTIDLKTTFTAEELSNVLAVRVNTNSQSGSVVLKNVYLEKPFELVFDDTGTAYITPADMDVSGMTLDPATGLLTKEAAGSASVTVALGDMDFTDVTSITFATETGADAGYADLGWRTFVYKTDGSSVDGWYSSKYGINYADYQAGSEHIQSIVLETTYDVTGSMVLSSICIKKDVVMGMLGNEVCLKELPFYVKQSDGSFTATGTPAWNMNVDTDHVYGDGVDVQQCKSYADLDSYEEIHVYQTSGNNTLRFWFFNADNTNIETIYPEVVEGKDYSVINIAAVKEKCGGKAYLTGAKSTFGNTVMVSNITVTDPNAPFDYVLTGKGSLNAKAQAALADASATVIDATGLTNATARELVSANPNCLFVVSDASKLSNAKNVLVESGGGYTCANLDLEAGYPFRAPFDFTASAAVVNKTVGDTDFATLVIPFDAEVKDGNAYVVDGVEADGTTLVLNETVELFANLPVLVCGSPTYSYSATDVTVAATPASFSNGLLGGTYETIDAPAASYVLQIQEGASAAFYKSAEGQTVKPFTAYLVAPAESAQANRYAISLRTTEGDGEDGTTAVESAAAQETAPVVVEIYDLTGRLQSAPVKGLNLMKMSDGSVKKVIVK